MDPSVLTGLLPLGGASVLLVYLLQIWLTERKSWNRERQQMYDLWMRERQELIDLHRVDISDRDLDYRSHIAALRDRVRALEEALDLSEQRQDERGS